jgi:hypothetical protein
MNENRLRSALEIATAVLLGLVSVATAAGAYQASMWSQQSNEYAAIAGQLRDDSLSTFIASDLAGFDDGERLSDALDLEFDVISGTATGTEVDAIREQQAVILGAATPGVLEEWNEWVAAGYPNDSFPTQNSPEYAAIAYAPTYGANQASTVAYKLSDAIGTRSLQVTVASVIFALALLLLGVSGANASLKVSFVLAVGGAGAFLVGLVISALAAIG